MCDFGSAATGRGSSGLGGWRITSLRLEGPAPRCKQVGRPVCKVSEPARDRKFASRSGLFHPRFPIVRHNKPVGWDVSVQEFEWEITMSIQCLSPAFDSTVDRTLVHRSSTAEVLPTSFLRVGMNDFVAGLQWPRRHAFYQPERLDSALVAETVRQATVLTLHKGLEVPLDHKFLMSGFGFRIPETPPLLVRRAAPVELIARLRASDARQPGSELRGARVDVEIVTHLGDLVAEGYGVARVCTPLPYTRLRRSGQTSTMGQTPRVAKLEPHLVGRQHSSDVLVAAASAGARRAIQADLHQPYFFDHALDHVPGVALIEAIRQYACAERGAPELDFRQFDASFMKIVEHAPLSTVGDDPDTENAFLIAQRGSVCVRATAHFTDATVRHRPEGCVVPRIDARPRAELELMHE